MYLIFCSSVSGKIKIEVTNGIIVELVRVNSILEEELFVSSRMELDFTNVVVGIYILTTETNREGFTKKIIKE